MVHGLQKRSLLMDETERVVRKNQSRYSAECIDKGSSLVSMQSKVFFCRQESDCTEQFGLWSQSDALNANSSDVMTFQVVLKLCFSLL